MCAEKIHRFMMTAMLLICIWLIIVSMEMIAVLILGFMAVMMAAWAIFDFCPALTILGKITNRCCVKPESK